ncbi:glycosyltransferase family 4 protein [Capnocytophaga felis]|uniref:Glycosyl transferase family 1 n=1 Tax=Capnocytophaga felis TaxID=2267611 RepID=A0A5M4BB46_9FLAO|nr:glycosyltransferase family 4 protein [Capnocytophaga felis]GET46798.1 glycosyl transferase family 1 [Capnocytophaga felis]GET48500.1 glycosyl transferase family 1 [Capnocytophaga felis]
MKKVLIITYYWKPAGGPGVQRWLKFIKYLRDFNIEPIVYTPENPEYPIIDERIGEDLPSNIQVIKYPIWEPYKLASFFSKKKTQKISSGIIPRKKVSFIEKIMLWIRGNLFIPDARKFWIKPSVNFLSNFIQENEIQTVITTSPPHSVHLIGYHLKKKFPQLKWISDFRDPWTTIGYYKDLRLTKWAHKKHKFLEKEVLQSSDLVIVTSFKTKEEFSQITKKPIKVITNGYDIINQPKAKVSDKFLISHIGSLLSDRNPKLLWKVLADLVIENKEFAENFELCFAGKISGDVEEEIISLGLSKYITNMGYISHNEAIKLQQKSQILLLIEINSKETECIIPGKLFEYMISERPILAIGPKNWDVIKIIKETNTGRFVSYDNETKIKEIILTWYNDYKDNNLKTNPIRLAPYSRKNLTQKLAESIQNV